MSDLSAMSEKSVLVVGASGFIGRHTVARLAQNKYHLYATHLPSEAPPAIPGVDWIPCDLTKPDALSAWPERCENLIYLAQSPKWRHFPDFAGDVFDINLAAVLRSAEYARRAGTQRFIFASTGSVYGQTLKPAYEYDAILMDAPRRFYEATKLAAEVLLGPYKQLFKIVVLRLFIPYGIGQDANMLIPQLVHRVRTMEPISLHGQDGLLANPVAVSDVAEVLERCLSLDESATLNVAGPEKLSLREIGTFIGQILNQKPIFEIHSDEIPPVLVGDTTSMKTILGWSPETRFISGLRTWLDAEKEYVS